MRPIGTRSEKRGAAHSDYYSTKVNTRRREHDLIRQLERLTGKKVTLKLNASTPAA
jgi:hypothetical protein